MFLKISKPAGIWWGTPFVRKSSWGALHQWPHSSSLSSMFCQFGYKKFTKFGNTIKSTSTDHDILFQPITMSLWPSLTLFSMQSPCFENPLLAVLVLVEIYLIWLQLSKYASTCQDISFEPVTKSLTKNL